MFHLYAPSGWWPAQDQPEGTSLSGDQWAGVVVRRSFPYGAGCELEPDEPERGIEGDAPGQGGHVG